MGFQIVHSIIFLAAAGTIAVISYDSRDAVAWWCPLLAFPVLMLILNKFVPPQNFMMFMATSLVLPWAYRIAAVVICVTGFDSWWGAAVGLFVGQIGAMLIEPVTKRPDGDEAEPQEIQTDT